MPYNQRKKEIFNFLMNIVKLAVGINSISELRSKQEFKRKKYGNNNHITRLFPKKHIEIKNGGSMFWVINGFISARQEIKDIKKVEIKEDRSVKLSLLFDLDHNFDKKVLKEQFSF